jgi:hypothetical protein
VLYSIRDYRGYSLRIIFATYNNLTICNLQPADSRQQTADHTNQMVIHNANTTHSRMSSESYVPPSEMSATHPHAHFDLEAGVGTTDYAPGTSPNHSNTTARHSTQSVPDHDVSKIPIAPIILKRRATRAATAQSNGTTTGRTLKTVNESSKDKSWKVGQEPGLDPSKPNGGRQQSPQIHEECQVTVVDFSELDMEMHDFDNKGIINFLQKPQDDWIKCRWINVNGISWDVIQALGTAKGLHRLAIEDLVNTKNRTKVDWLVTSH